MVTTDPLANAVETFAAPIEDLIVALGQGLSQAQHALDQNAIQTQQAIDTDPFLSQYGLQATWYQFPSVTVQLKLSLSITTDQAPAPTAGGHLLTRGPLHIIAQPTSASFQTHFNYDAQAATQVNLTVVPVPPPQTASPLPPQMTAAGAQVAALNSTAPFVTTTDAQGSKSFAATDSQGDVLSLLTNFNAVARVWYVIQYAPSNASVQPVVVAVDDATKSVRIISTP